MKSTTRTLKTSPQRPTRTHKPSPRRRKFSVLTIKPTTSTSTITTPQIYNDSTTLNISTTSVYPTDFQALPQCKYLQTAKLKYFKCFFSLSFPNASNNIQSFFNPYTFIPALNFRCCGAFLDCPLCCYWSVPWSFCNRVWSAALPTKRTNQGKMLLPTTS